MSDRTSTQGTCIVVDLESYSSLDGVRQEQAQRVLDDALRIAAGRAGLRRLTWDRQPAGDGELAVVPETEPLREIVGSFPLALDAVLREQHSSGQLRLRLRMAIVHGRITPARLGYADHAVVAAARIADAPAVRQALATVTEGRVVLALSAEVYRDVIKRGDTDLRQEQFWRVPVDRIDADAWVTIPGVDTSGMAIEADLHHGPSQAEPAAFQTAINTVNTEYFQIGHRYDR